VASHPQACAPVRAAERARTILRVCVVVADADALAGERAQVRVGDGQEHAEQRLPVHADACQEANEHADSQHQERGALDAQQRQQRALHDNHVGLGACHLLFWGPGEQV
jgi:hypothetical protein